MELIGIFLIQLEIFVIDILMILLAIIIVGLLERIKENINNKIKIDELRRNKL